VSLITPAVYREHDAGTSLGDDALQRIIDSNEGYMVRVLGPHSREGSPILEIQRGRTRGLLAHQPIGSVVQIREQASGSTDWTVLDATDYLLENGGQTLTRLSTGTNASSRWASLVEITYVPAANLAERIAALLEMVGTDVGAGVTSGGISSRTMGSWSETYAAGGGGSTAGNVAKDAILARLHPRGGIVLA
jgi:hypothetical protein